MTARRCAAPSWWNSLFTHSSPCQSFNPSVGDVRPCSPLEQRRPPLRRRQVAEAVAVVLPADACGARPSHPAAGHVVGKLVLRRRGHGVEKRAGGLPEAARGLTEVCPKFPEVDRGCPRFARGCPGLPGLSEVARGCPRFARDRTWVDHEATSSSSWWKTCSQLSFY